MTLENSASELINNRIIRDAETQTTQLSPEDQMHYSFIPVHKRIEKYNSLEKRFLRK